MTTGAAYNDQELFVLLREGKPSAFAEIYNRYSTLLFIHADNKLRDKDEAKDVVQDVLAKLWEKREELDVTANLAGYLYTAVRNKIFDLIKHKKVISGYMETFFAPDANGEEYADHLIRERQFAAMIAAEIEALSPRIREVFELRRLENLSNKEVAKRLNITESTAADYMKKAIKILKPRIGLILICALMMQNRL
uniref:RNA polymerase sigma factor n=1 Tax=Pedobacter schmidteae TaxID=2201271 RepID=UPI000EAC0AB2|nr:RNA polymerase sigma-70 factor [Pedobacter schmidteae]